jgi:hypothetical protein
VNRLRQLIAEKAALEEDSKKALKIPTLRQSIAKGA